MNYYYENRYHLLDDQTPLSIYVNDDFEYRAHWHTEFELVYIQEGSQYLTINNDRRKLVEGDMAICQSGDIHYFEKGDKPSKTFILVFKPEYFGLGGNQPDEAIFEDSFITGDIISNETREYLYTMLMQLFKEKENKEAYYQWMVKGLVTQIAALLLRHLTISKKSDPKSRLTSIKTIQQVLEYIEECYTDPITLNGLAQKFAVDPYNLSKKFNSLTGNNLKTHLNMLRIAKAEKMILQTDLTLLDIAMECGFESVRTFNRTFKHIKEVTPSSLRQKDSIDFNIRGV